MLLQGNPHPQKQPPTICPTPFQKTLQSASIDDGPPISYPTTFGPQLPQLNAAKAFAASQVLPGSKFDSNALLLRAEFNEIQMMSDTHCILCGCPRDTAMLVEEYNDIQMNIECSFVKFSCSTLPEEW